jgi:hypothetical protein
LRFAASRLTETLADTPSVPVLGPRQRATKTTLAKPAGESNGYAYASFDDAVAPAAARRDPVGLVGDLTERVIVDEVQRVQEHFGPTRR